MTHIRVILGPFSTRFQKVSPSLILIQNVILKGN
jgi:hypothetical protein